MKYGIRTSISAQVGMTSLVGIVSRRDYPLHFGNYFSFYVPGSFYGIRCLNMWAENFTEAKKRFDIGDTIEGYLFTEETENDPKLRQWFIVDDPRIEPLDKWTFKDFCWTGSYSPFNIDMIGEMYSIHGDPTNELERFTDPTSYHQKRGEEYIVNGNFAYVKKTVVTSPSRTLKANWTVEEAELLQAEINENAIADIVADFIDQIKV